MDCELDGVTFGAGVSGSLDFVQDPSVRKVSREFDVLHDTRDKHVTRVISNGVDLQAFGFDGGHEWNADVSGAAAAFLQRFRG